MFGSCLKKAARLRWTAKAVLATLSMARLSCTFWGHYWKDLLILAPKNDGLSSSWQLEIHSVNVSM